MRNSDDPGGPHRVMRQDDNGNRFLLARGLGRAEAEALAAEFEARGHKQLYWVEPELPTDPAEPFPGRSTAPGPPPPLA
ncbi:hypothetical protein [Streptomyces sp. TLI_171]|uniref:hypothetical protein n=1 Tax=Streptomyces sp. TLI_171 TaxID=1938859 RepID=UPI000C19053C|nr:hypothetical protein [Streptomyces sp. TLI_171]RKE20945.1 hypothetical protein BX266_4322 [Streptomyces sp. TLI_171]